MSATLCLPLCVCHSVSAILSEFVRAGRRVCRVLGTPLSPLPFTQITTADLDTLHLDFFVNNCDVSKLPHGFAVRVQVNGAVVGEVHEWSPCVLSGVRPVHGKVVIRAALVNPAGQEVTFPPYNTEPVTLEVDG